MCDVCVRQYGPLDIIIERFLGDGFKVAHTREEEWEELYLINPKGDKLQLTADGDEGGYFHIDPPKPRYRVQMRRREL